MADFSVTDALGVGAGLIRRKPLAVLAWGVLPALVIVPLFLLFGGAFIALVAQAVKASGDQTALAQAVLPLIGGVFLFILLVGLAAWVLGAIVYAAAFRAVLHPEQSAFFYLRFGAAELWLMATSFVLGLVFFGVGVVFAIPQAIVGVALFNAPTGEKVAVDLLFTLARLAVTIWIWLRLSLGMPMTFASRQFRLFESWALTRGHAWALFRFALLAVVVIGLIDVWLVAIGVAGGIGLAGGAFAAAQANPQAFFADPRSAIGAFGAAIALWAVLLVIISGVATAILRAPFAYIYQRLAGDEAVAQTFT